MFKFKNQAGFSDSVVMLIISSIIAILFITGVFIWQEINIHKTVANFFTSLNNNKINQIINKDINNFEDCVASGQPILESYPRQCISKDGDHFIENIDGPTVDITMIRVDEPKAGEFVASPLLIKGQARGTWFFEGDFPIILTDENSNEIALAIASTEDEWMTEDFVDFEVEMTFEKPESNMGFLILKKDNPSGLTENDDSIAVPIFFK